LRPRSLWLYHLLLHRLEAPVGVAPPAAQERLTRLLLDLLASSSTASLATTTRLAARLHLDPQLLERFLVDLEKTGLLQSARGEPGWVPTTEAQQFLAGERPLRPVRERRTLYFAESPRSEAPPRFIPLDRPSTSGLSAVKDWHFDASVLRGDAEQSAEWKRRHGFPIDVVGLASPADEAWEQVVIDRPEQMLALFVLAGADAAEEALLGFAVQPDGWRLQTDRPVLTLREGWQEVLPELDEELPPEAWRQAWQAWGQAHGRQQAEIEVCSLEPKGLRLRVTAPPSLAEQLHASGGDLKGEAWVLAGEGRLRRVAVIEILSPSQGEAPSPSQGGSLG
jgi:hypothetical protein